jgi:LPXTG-motif cell wall-anchored protein
MRRFLGVMTFAVATMAVVALPASAQDEPPVIDIPLETVARGAAGTEQELTTVPVDAEDVGQQCSVVADGTNNSSVHENTDLLVRSGESEVAVLDVEREPEAVTQASGTLVLGPEISVFVRFGPDGVFSGGVVLTVDCTQTTTTSEAPTTTVAETTTSAAAPTTTVWDETPTTTVPELPNTGAGTDGLLVAAGLILLLGAGALVGSAKLRQRSHG